MIMRWQYNDLIIARDVVLWDMLLCLITDIKTLMSSLSRCAIGEISRSAEASESEESWHKDSLCHKPPATATQYLHTRVNSS